MLASMWQSADVTVGCLEVPRMEATGFGVMPWTRRPHRRLRGEAERPARHAGQPDMALATMGIYVFETKFLIDQLRRDAADPIRATTSARTSSLPSFKDGKAVAHRFARSCVRTTGRGGGLLARRRHDRCLLGGQYRPDRRRAGARPLRPRLADLDLCRDHAAGEVRSRRGRAERHGRRLARLRRLHRLGRPDRQSLLFTDVPRALLFAASTDAVILPYVDDRPNGARRKVVIDRGVRIPEGLVVGEDPRSTPALPPHRAGRLPHHAADDRPAGGMTA